MSFPVEVAFEPTNKCNLQCALCENPRMTRPFGYMDLAAHNKVIDEIKSFAKRADYSINAEPLLHPQTPEMIAYSHKAGLDTFLGTNGILLKHKAKALVESGLNYTNISMDGATKETYEKYRIPRGDGENNFANLKAGVEELCREKEKQGTIFPKVQISFMVNKYSEPEIPQITQWAKSVGVNTVLLKAMHFYWTKTKEEFEQARQNWLPQNQKYWRTFSRSDLPSCNWADTKAVVLWDGRLGSCCNDILGRTTFDNVFEIGFKKAWENKFSDYRNGRMRARILPQCAGCSDGVKFYGEFLETNKTPLIKNLVHRVKKLVR